MCFVERPHPPGWSLSGTVCTFWLVFLLRPRCLIFATAPRPPVPPPAFVAALGIDAPTWATLQVLLFIATIVLLPLLCSANTETPQARVQLAAARVREAQRRQQLRERLRAFSRQ